MNPLPVLLLLSLSPQPAPPAAACPMRIEARDASGAPLPGATLVTPAGTQALGVTDEQGVACVSPARAVRVELPGFVSADLEATTGTVPVVLVPAFKADVEVAAARRDARLRDAPVRTEVVTRDFVEQIGARTLADAVEYTTGVRVENNCQNCNFSQVRLLGLEGPYTQILMDGQPTLSSLAQVYGLEQIPARMIDRVEVTKGGGAALLGPGSVGGVINVITREPTTRGAQLDTTLGLTGGEPTVTTAAALDWVSSDRRSLLTAYGQADRVSPVDVTGDGYTEVSERALEAGGVRAHRVLLDTRARLTLDASALRESRRGGNRLDLPPHEADIAEDIDTSRAAATVTWLHTPTARTDYRVTLSGADTQRDSYYGVGRDPLAYGDTRSQLGVADLLVNRYASRHVISGGVQMTAERLVDRQPGYGRSLDLRYDQIGVFVQDEWTVRPGWQLLTGVRVDRHSALTRPQVLPRAALRVSPRPALDLRVSYAQGIRAPQVFDEDLHIASVGGEARIVIVDPALRPERSVNVMAGGEWKPSLWGGQALLELNTFHTRLRDKFHLQEDDLPEHGRARVPEGQPGHGDRARRRDQRRLGPGRPCRPAGRCGPAAQHATGRPTRTSAARDSSGHPTSTATRPSRCRRCCPSTCSPACGSPDRCWRRTSPAPFPRIAWSARRRSCRSMSRRRAGCTTAPCRSRSPSPCAT